MISHPEDRTDEALMKSDNAPDDGAGTPNPVAPSMSRADPNDIGLILEIFNISNSGVCPQQSEQNIQKFWNNCGNLVERNVYTEHRHRESEV